MTRREEVKALVLAAAKPQAGLNFADVQSAARNALNAYFQEISGSDSVRALRYNSREIFAIIDEVIDEVVPAQIQDMTAQFAEVRRFARNEKVEFVIPTTYGSTRRQYTAVRRSARGGVYRAYRLDGKVLDMEMYPWAVAYAVTLEDLLTGQRTIAELLSIITNAWVERIFRDVVDALFTAAAAAPAANQNTGSTFSPADLDDIIEVVGAYGNPFIFGFRKSVAKIINVTLTNAGGAVMADLDDIRRQGFVQIYKGVPVVMMPDYFLDLNNTTFVFAQYKDTLLVLPANERPVKVAFKGEGYTQEIQQATGGVEYQNHQIVGMTVLFNNHIGSYEFSS
jgi:hypothetical protein